MTLALISWAVIPFSEDFVLANINVGILYLFAISSLGVYGIIMGVGIHFKISISGSNKICRTNGFI